jgi:hypothetical protein
MQAREVTMTRFSSIDAGAWPEAEQRAFQTVLITCCEQYCQELRGPLPPQDRRAHDAPRSCGGECGDRLLAQPVTAALPDAALEALCAAVLAVGVQFLGLNADALRFVAHGHEHKPVTRKHLAELLAEICHLRLA